MARAVSDNQSNSWTYWDLPSLRELLIELDSGDIDMSITGFNSHELELMMTAIKPDGEGGEQETEKPNIIICQSCGHQFSVLKEKKDNG